MLFFKYDMFGVLESQKKTVAKAAEAVPEHRLRAEPVGTLASELARKFTIDVPVIADDAITVSRPREVDVRLGRNEMFMYDDYSGRSIRGTSVTYCVPYTGDKVLFFVRPSCFTLNPPRASVGDGAIEMTYSGVSLDVSRVKAEFDSTLRSIKEYLGNQARDVAAFNTALAQRVEGYLNARKDRLKKGDELVSGLGYRVSD
ncbi:MAG: hypothetical protein KGJ79_16180 [Alphaproteobacteria bacterium]|nr:hypothetical protein [Alphaproteobacteria bacterium]MDE2494711.1 hypothetical protein [Alphaproteobacteria bacterium]